MTADELLKTWKDQVRDRENFLRGNEPMGLEQHVRLLQDDMALALWTINKLVELAAADKSTPRAE